MKKILWYTIFIMIILTGCSNGKTEDKGTETNDTVWNESETQNGGKDTDETTANYSNQALVNILKYVIDEETRQGKYGKLINEDIVYYGESVELGVDLYVEMGSGTDMDIPLMCMMILDGREIPFSINDSEINNIQYISMKNGSQERYSVKIVPYGVSETESKELLFVAVPFYDKSRSSVYDNMVVHYPATIISEAGELKAEEAVQDSEYFILEDLKQLYNKELWEISEHNGVIRDYIIQNEDGKIYYMGDYQAGEYETFLFCDGQLYNGFGGQYYLQWRKDDSGYINKEIDVSLLDGGEHSFFAVTIGHSEGENFCAVNKSLNTEVTVNE